MTALGTAARPVTALRPRRRRGWARRPAPVPAAVTIAALLALAGSLAWLLGPAFGTDLAAQAQWADDVGRHPLAAVDLSWYGGVYPMAYSVLAPYLFWLVGVRVAAAAATVAAAVLGARLLVLPRRRAVLAATWWAAALLADLVAGRATFACGTAVALLAVTAAVRGRPAWAVAGLAVLTGLVSPVAGLFLAVAGAGLLATARRRAGLLLGVGGLAAPAAVGLAFPQWGVQPITWDVAVPPLVAGLLVAWLTEHRPVRIGALVYAAGVAASWALPTPVGSNVERLGLLLAAPLLAVGVGSGRRLLAVLPLLAAWLVHVPVTVFAAGPDPMAAPGYNAALVRELSRVGATGGLVEAVPEADHWETVALAGRVPLARGWERQVDVTRNPLFYRGRLTAAAYHRWLRRHAVGYVALSDRPPDWAAAAEDRIVASRPPWLRLVWAGPHWRLFRVTDAVPLATPRVPVRVHASYVEVRVRAAGAVRLRLPYSPWLRAAPAGCVAPDGGGIVLRVPAAGTYRVTSSLLAGRAAPCR